MYVEQGREFTIQEALTAINLILEDEADSSREAPPVEAETQSRQFLRIFYEVDSVPRDQMQKFLKGTGMAPNDFIDNNWCYEEDKIYYLKHPLDYANMFKWVRRAKIGRDLDQAILLIGTCIEGSGKKATDILNHPDFKPHPALEQLLVWFQKHSPKEDIKRAAMSALTIYNNWQSDDSNKKKVYEELELFGMV